MTGGEELPSLTRGKSNEAGVRLLENFDEEKAILDFSQEVKEARNRIKTILQQRKDLPGKVRASLEVFISNNCDSKGEVNRVAIQELVAFLRRKIEIISLVNLQETARKVVVSNRSDNLTLFISGHKAREADFTSSESKNSNEFMAKLVSKYSKADGKETVILTDQKQAPDYEAIHVVDDSIYSGEQLASQFSGFVRSVKRPVRIMLHVAGSTHAGLEKIREKVRENPKIRLETHVDRLIPSLSKVLVTNAKAHNFFQATGMLAVLEDGRSPKEALAYAQDYLETTTLTISDVKTPDFLSFPSRLASGFARGTNETGYPNIDGM